MTPALRTRLARSALALALLAAAPGAAGAAAPASGGVAAANEAGAALFSAGRFEEAVERFREAARADPAAPGPRHNLAAALAALGQRELLAGRLDAARPRIEEAVRLRPEDPDLLELLAALHLARGELHEARRAAGHVLDLAPARPGALEILGDLEYREGFLDAARRRWEEARRAGGARAAALDAKLARLDREADTLRSFGRSVSPHFTAQFDGSVPPAVAREVLRTLEEQHARLAREFARAPRNDIPVILSSRVLFASVTGSPPWAGGAFDGKIRIPVGGLGSEAAARRLAPLLAHELAHAFLRENVAVPLPLWFEEGLAEHLAGADPDDARRILRGAGAPFPSLAAVAGALRGGPRVDAAYAAAHLAVADLVRRGGSFAPRRIVELVGAGTPFPEAFRAAAGIELAAFDALVSRGP